MASIVGWRMEEGKIILSLIGDDGKEYTVELPLDVYKELLVSGPPTEEQRIRELIDKIHEVREKRILIIDKILEAEEKLRDEIQDARKELKGAGDKLEVSIWMGVLQSVTKERAILQEYRHLCKLTYQEEGKLRVQLLTKLRG